MYKVKYAIPIIVFNVLLLWFCAFSFKRSSYFFDDIGKFSEPNLQLVVLSFFLLTITYVAIAMIFRNITINFKRIFVSMLPIFIILFVTPPFLSTDSYVYIASVKNTNPYNPNIVNIGNNPWSGYVSTKWLDKPSVYGPVFNIFVSFISFATSDFVVAYYIYKFLILFCFLISVVVLRKILQKLEFSDPNYYLILYIFNPVILIHTLLEAHNDSIVLLFTLISTYYLLNNKKQYSLVSLVVGSLVKYTNLILCPVFFVKDKKLDIKNSLYFVGLLLVTTIIAFEFFGGFKLSYFSQLLTFHLTFSKGCFNYCSPFISISKTIFGDGSNMFGRIVFVLAYIFVFYLYIYRRVDYVKFSFWALFLLLFVYTPWLVPWYLALLIPYLIILSKEPFYKSLLFLITFYGLFHYVL